MSKPSPPLTYRDAGVDIDAGDALVDAIKPLAAKTQRTGCLGGLGGFGGLFDLASLGYAEPILVSGTDGVGTKLKLAVELNRHDTIGIDLVAMCVNDVLVQGAEPLFFLDYFACGRLDPDTALAVVGGIAEGCGEAGAALIGGETAEMPGMYAEGEYDLAGFCVGAVERSRLLDGSQVAPGDTILGLASSGGHSNGYSLIRKLLSDHHQDLGMDLSGQTLGEALLAPTRIYVKSVLTLLPQLEVHALAHITGGGLPGNLNRILPAGTRAELNAGDWSRAPVFDWIEDTGRISAEEMLRTFNCGIGMAVVVAAGDARTAREILQTEGETVFEIGRIVAHNGTPDVVIR